MEQYLTKDGDLIIPETYDNYTLPDNLKIQRDLIIRSTNITTIPKSIRIGRSLIAPNMNITCLPVSLHIKKDLILSHNPIQCLPTGLTVKGKLALDNTLINEIPEDLHVGGFLDLSNTYYLKKMPKIFCVGQVLLLTNSALEQYPTTVICGLDFVPNVQNIKNSIEHIYFSRHCPLIYMDNISTKLHQLSSDMHLELDEQHKYIYVQTDRTAVQYKRVLSYVDRSLFVGCVPEQHIFRENSLWEYEDLQAKTYVCCNFTEGIIRYLSGKNNIKGIEKYKHLTLNSRITREEAKKIYQDVTGVCTKGIDDFYDNLFAPKKYWTIKELIELTKGHKGNGIFRYYYENKDKKELW